MVSTAANSFEHEATISELDRDDSRAIEMKKCILGILRPRSDLSFSRLLSKEEQGGC
jgi:hypothetical protein